MKLCNVCALMLMVSMSSVQIRLTFFSHHSINSPDLDEVGAVRFVQLQGCDTWGDKFLEMCGQFGQHGRIICIPNLGMLRRTRGIRHMLIDREKGETTKVRILALQYINTNKAFKE